MSSGSPQVMQLLSLLLDGQATPEQEQQIVELLKTDDAAVRQYVRVMMLHATLQWEHSAPLAVHVEEASPLEEALALEAHAAELRARREREETEHRRDDADFWLKLTQQMDEPIGPPVRHIVIPRTTLYIAAMLLVAVGLGIIYRYWPAATPATEPPGAIAHQPSVEPHVTPQPKPEPSVPPAPIYARLAGACAAAWTTDTGLPLTLAQGDPLPSDQTLVLRQGVAQLAIENNIAVIEAPARFTVRSSQRLDLAQGKVYGIVNDTARNLTIHTPTAVIVDLGTEFGVRVQPTGESDVVVYSGRVAIYPGATEVDEKTPPAQVLEKATAAQITHTGIHPLEPAAVDFLRDLPDSYTWELLATRPLAYWNFADSQEGRIANLLSPYRMTGRIEGAALIDRDDAVAGASLRLVDDTACVVIDDEPGMDDRLTAYTVAMWVKPLSTTPQNIFLRTHSELGPIVRFSHQVRIDEQGRFAHYVFSSVDGSISARADNYWYLDAPATDSPKPGEWQHVVISAQDHGWIRLYINGREQKAVAVPGRLQREMNQWRIGGPSGLVSGEQSQPFTGWVDEIVLYDRVLTPAEITHLFNISPAGARGSNPHGNPIGP